MTRAAIAESEQGRKNMTHTPTPLTIHGLALYRGDVHVAQGLAYDTSEVASIVIEPNDRTFEEAVAEMETIVRAVNCHDELVAALKAATAQIEVHAATARHEANLGLAEEIDRHVKVYRATLAKAGQVRS